MHILNRPFSGPADLPAMLELAHQFPADHLHVMDLPYRLCSWALDDPARVGLWANDQDQLLAWAVMQSPFWTIDCVCRPDLDDQLYGQILVWANDRAQQILPASGGRPTWFVMVFAHQAGRIRHLKQAGFACQSNMGEDSWEKVWLRHTDPLPVASKLPANLTIRPLAGPGEVEAYVALHQAVFESRNMTVEWRNRTFYHPSYTPHTDLVAAAPDGRLAAFCIGWLDQDSLAPAPLMVGQIEPLGVHADWRGQGLGQAILLECLRRLRQAGAGPIYVETDAFRSAALGLYESVGFQVIQRVEVYRQDVLPAEPNSE